MQNLEQRGTAMSASQHEAPEPASSADRVVVLLVDDQRFVGEVLRRLLLDHADIVFHHCQQATEAIASAKKIQPTVILQDLVMPDGDGLTLVQQYRATAATKDTPVIVLSSTEDAAVKRDAFKGGANDYLVKLPDKIELVARIRLHSNAYRMQIQRDEAYRDLSESQRQLVVSNNTLADRIRELQAVRDELSRMVSTDSLTGLFSRRHWFDVAATEFARYRRYGHPLTFLMADLDLFKKVNDTYGHDVGDEVLQEFGNVLRAACRATDAIGRVGGEEFAILLPETPLEGAEEVARRIVAACHDNVVSTSAGPVKFTCSVGVTNVTKIDTAVAEVMRRADSALYEAKQAGRNGWRSNDASTRLTTDD